MVALQRAGIPVERYVAYEIDKYAISISKKNYPEIEHCGDVFDGDFTQYKDFDLLLGGSPCQNWSCAKAEKREITPDGVGGRLFMQYVKALKESECRYFLYENVYSMHKEIKNFITEQLGVEPIMINSALVSGQQRKRLYWTNIPNVTQPEDKGILLKDIIEDGLVWTGKSYCIDACYHKGASLENNLKKHKRTLVAQPIQIGLVGEKDHLGSRVYSVEGKSVSIKANGGGMGANTGLYRIDLPDGDYICRKLSPIEVERCQTLPDNYTKEGKIGDTITQISATQRYKCVGNGWTINVIAHILKGLKEVKNE